MKYALFLLFSLCACLQGSAQQVEFKTFIYTSNDLGEEIARHSELVNRKDRGYLGDLFNASKESLKGIASGYVTSFIDLGVNAIGSLLTRNARLKEEWEETVKAENIYKTKISTVSEINDFYKEASFEGAMDPKGMRFDGIGCLRLEDNDTVFYLSCHIDRSKIDRIVKHSKFELVLDTLIVSPTHSNLPNTYLDLPYSFAERDNFTLSMNIKLISSWMNEIVQLQKNQELGAFVLNVPVDPEELDEKGFQFSSANSINIGRLVPQIVYYVYAYVKLLAEGQIEEGEKINVVVPTGNFGNILAAFYAKNMGLPINKLICASNENKVLYDFFQTGTYDRNREFVLTSSPSMDILISSNLERLIYRLTGNDSDATADFMKSLSDNGNYVITDGMKEQLGDFRGYYATEEETAQTIHDLYDKCGYVIDTHTAVAAAA